MASVAPMAGIKLNEGSIVLALKAIRIVWLWGGWVTRQLRHLMACRCILDGARRTKADRE